MPRIFLSALLVAGVAACTALAPEVRKLDGSPVYPPAAFPAVVLDQAPTRAYIQVGVIDAKGVAGMDATQLLARIREQAQKLGADAVVLKDASVRTPAESRFNPATGGYSVTQGQIVPAFEGIAIKYR